IALLQYQVQELDEFAPTEGEFDRLEEDYKRLANANRLLEVCHGLLAQLSENETAVDTQLHHAIRSLREILKFDPSLDKIVDLLDVALIQLTEAADELRLYADRLDIDPDSLAAVEKRLDSYHDAARKHQVQPQQLSDHLQTLRIRLDQL